MTTVLALVPVVVAIVLLLTRRGTVVASLVGFAASVIVAVFCFPTSWEVVRESGIDYFPLIIEVALILLFGMTLARLLEANGAMRVISNWVRTSAPNQPLGVALVIFGLVPFAESVTGFGIGVTIGVPILAHLGCSIRHSAILGLLGLIAVPWGALGPGTTVAAALSGLDVDALGLSTAWINAIPVALVGLTVILITRPGWIAALGILGAAGLLWAGILTANLILGMAPAGIIGSLLVIVVLGAIFAIGKSDTGLSRELGRAAIPYAVLTVGLLIARGLAVLFPGVAMAIISSPPFWLAAACLIAAISCSLRRRLLSTAARSWAPIGAATVAFMLLGWVMTTTGMSTAIGGMLPTGLLFLTPWLTVIGSVLTGSNTGANSMFTGTLNAAALDAGASPLAVIAAGNAAGSLAALATPPRVAMAVQMADSSQPAEPADTAWVQRTALIVVGTNTIAIGLWLQFLS